ncbi:mobilization protein [Olivibacter sp. SDN3]|uniref:mobilization protein n=1 Tax=unclassified Olivibacter TaxID=2632301 RepID=UPI001651A46A|nr:mobilization protein [Olivibacter sp. SDN3]QNL50310.1 mobilization protein [Olivibacter sp. SDN3]
MPRKKIKDQEQVLTNPIVIRVTLNEFNKLEKVRKESDCRSIGEVVRKMLLKQRITYLHKDISMNGPMEELALIRKEIKAIGVNINQQTHRFHTSQNEAERAFFALKTASTYKQMEPKLEHLLSIVSKLAEKWLHGS